jgi:phytoene desaturase
MQRKAIIIGSGIAGLATSIRLACQGWQVQVFEKNNYAGGKLSSFAINGFQFDAGPSLFTQPEYIEELFAIAQEDITQYFSYVSSPVSCHYFFADGSTLQAPTNANAFAEVLAHTFSEDKQKVLQYLQHSKQAFESIGMLFTQYSLHKKTSFKNGRLFKALKATKLAYLTKTLHSYNSNYFKHPNSVQLFNRYATYNGSNPYKAPAMLSMIPHFEINIGTYYPLGGMISITNALHKLALQKGVQFALNSEVKQICIDNNRITGVKVNEAIHNADIVVSNMDVYYTYKKLLHNETLAANILKQERSSSAFIFYWGVHKNFTKLGLHKIFFSKNYQQEFHAIFNETELNVNDVTVYINITSKMETGQAPEGCENWFVMINTPAHNNHNWDALQPKLKELVIQIVEERLGEPLTDFIKEEAILTPKDIETRTASYMGSLYGTSSNSKTAAFMRQRNKSNSIEGLYFVGGSVHPGGGIPLCLGSAAIVGNWVKEIYN